MGLLDFTSSVLVAFKGDTADLKSKLKELTGAEKDLHTQLLASATERNKGLESWVANLANVNQVLGLVTKGVDFLKESWSAYATNLRMTNAAGTASIEGLTKATRGLRTEIELLSDAALLQHGQFKLTQDQMELVERAMIGLNRRGFESVQVHDAVMSAVIGLKDRGLKELGIVVDKTGLSMDTAAGRAQVFKNIMVQLGKAGADVKDGQLTAAEGVKHAGVELADAWEKLKVGIGALVVAFAPLLSALGSVAGYVGQIVADATKGRGASPMAQEAAQWAAFQKQGGSAFEFHGLPGSEQLEEWNAAQAAGKPAEPNAYAAVSSAFGLGGRIGSAVSASADRGGFGDIGAKMDRFEERMKKAAEQYATALEKAKAFREEIRQLVIKQSQELTDELVADLSSDSTLFDASVHRSGSGRRTWTGPATTLSPGGRFAADIDPSLMRQGYSLDYGGGAGTLKQLWEKPAAGGDNAGVLDKFYGDYFQTGSSSSGYGKQQAGAYNEFRKKQGKGFLEETFGPVEDFNAYKTAFDMLAGSTSAALGAWIDGSESAGKAFKKFIGEALKGLASQMLIESLKHLAYALGSIAMYDVAGAAAHLAAAAAFGAGAIAAAVASKELGGGASGGGGNASGGTGSAAPVGPAAGAAPANQTQSVIVVGDSFAEDTPRMRQLKAQRLVGLAVGNNAIVYG